MTEWFRHAFAREVITHPAATKIAVVGSVMYVGVATPGTQDADPHWQIRRVETFEDGGISMLWADGNDFFDNVWDSREVLDYA